MGKIAVVTDSTADLPSRLIEEYNINVIPLKVRLDGKEYEDGIDISREEFLDKLEESNQVPTTSQPPIGKFLDLYKALAKEYDQILSLHFSEKLSGTIKTAHLAANMLEDIDIKVIDSETVTVPLGVMVVEIAKAVKAGKQMNELINLIAELKESIKIYFTIDDLTYLERGGRIGKATAFIGNLFNVKPMLTIEAGEITPYKKLRGEKRLYKEFMGLAEKELEGNTGHKLVIIYGKYLDKANQLKEILTQNFEWEEIDMLQFGSVVGAHVGPTPFGMIVYK
ncbi:DegV family protein with EDD domain [Orenia metallireducens]|uniref:EDD domain protein, DegV family n=1 Tax=Orenia metallireducens TaxID=1413210 RepID=A0A285GEQ3_9FIRM|nr:DegV family protein [Orenia metallireducens]PRX30365.1 DegV family protein with EDD domain [Orenia metallireducens]SNY22069.1 EDD domain protein, DegV family [Orenia metallireducens]